MQGTSGSQRPPDPQQQQRASEDAADGCLHAAGDAQEPVESGLVLGVEAGADLRGPVVYVRARARINPSAMKIASCRRQDASRMAGHGSRGAACRA